MTISVFYYEPLPDGGYVEPVPVAYYFDEHSMTVLQSGDPLVVEFVSSGGTIAPYQVPSQPSPPPVLSPTEKLIAFLRENPDVSALLEG